MVSYENPLIQFPKITDSRGTITFIESTHHIPFEIKRVYYLYNIPSKANRGAHGHKKLHQVIIPIIGSFVMLFDNGCQKKIHHLKSPNVGLYIPPLVWHDLKEFSPGTICLVLASEHYDENDYLRDHNEFKKSVDRNL